VNTYPVEIPLIPLEEGGLGPFISGFHRVENARSIIVKVGTDEGIVGWGEMKDVFLSPRVMKSIVEEKLLPKIVGKDPFDILSIIKDLSFTVSSQYFTGSFFACGIEVACWDIVGKIIDKPIYKLLGGRFRDRIPICHVSGMMSVDKTAEKAKQAVDKGYQTFKTKAGRDVIDDIARVKAIRQAVGSEVEVRVDPNQLYTMVEALHFLKEVEECNLEFIEQPIRINSFSDLASLRNRTRTPIAVNEDCYLQTGLPSFI
jgi:L-alanine-DL-glutamate epimerase-like enolase superfamily enzyme